MLNYYEILEVSEKASKEVIEKAYKVLAKKYHPDLNQDNKKEAELKMQKVNEAFEVLSDDKKRANYDNILAKKRQLEHEKDIILNNVSCSQESKNDSFFSIKTQNMDEKTKRKLQAKMQERYLEAYDAYLRQRGYKLKYKWTFKKFLQAVLIVLICIIVFTILFFIPPIHEYCLKLYSENIIIQLIVNFFGAIINTILSIFR